MAAWPGLLAARRSGAAGSIRGVLRREWPAVALTVLIVGGMHVLDGTLTVGGLLVFIAYLALAGFIGVLVLGLPRELSPTEDRGSIIGIGIVLPDPEVTSSPSSLTSTAVPPTQPK